MVKGKTLVDCEKLSAKNILKLVSDEDIFKKYLDFKLNKPFCSPLSKDQVPSAMIKRTQAGNTRFIDFRKEGAMGVFEFLQEYWNCSYGEVLNRIDFDFHLNLGSVGNNVDLSSRKVITNKVNIKTLPTIKVITRNHTKDLLSYYNDYHLDISDLKRGYIFDPKEVYINGQRLLNPRNLLRIAYYYPTLDRWKIYQPYADRNKGDLKWFSSVPLDTLTFTDPINKTNKTLINKSRKDWLCASKVYEFSIPIENESLGSITDSNAQFINDNSLEVFYCGDLDDAGKLSANRITEKFKWNNLVLPDRILPMEKDLAGLSKLEGLNAVKIFLNENNICM